MRNKFKQLLACNTVTIYSSNRIRYTNLCSSLLTPQGLELRTLLIPKGISYLGPKASVVTPVGGYNRISKYSEAFGPKPILTNPYRNHVPVTKGQRGLVSIGDAVVRRELLTCNYNRREYSIHHALLLGFTSPYHLGPLAHTPTRERGLKLRPVGFCSNPNRNMVPVTRGCRGLLRTCYPLRPLVTGTMFRLGLLQTPRGVKASLLSPRDKCKKPLAVRAWRIRETLGGKSNGPMFNKYFLSDFVHIQRKSFFTLLEKGLIEEFSKRNPITNTKKTMEAFFYPEYYQLTPPEYTPSQAILKSKSYTSRLYIPVQLTDKTSHIIKLKWVYIGNIPLMTKRGHFILNGCARVIVNQMIRSPGLYFQKKIYENYVDQWSEKPEETYERYYADLICNRGTWLRIEIDKYNRIWAQMKKVPKIPIMWFLISTGLPEKTILSKVIDSQMLLYNFLEDPTKQKPPTPLPYVKTPPAAWTEIYNLVTRKKNPKKEKTIKTQKKKEKKEKNKNVRSSLRTTASPILTNPYRNHVPVTKSQRGLVLGPKASVVTPVGSDYRRIQPASPLGLAGTEFRLGVPVGELQSGELREAEAGRKWIFNKFMNPRTYDLGNVGRANFNLKLNLSISTDQTTLTPQDLLSATSYLILVSKGLLELDDIDHLKNRRVRTSGELIQLQIGIGLVRLEKNIREKMNKIHSGTLQSLSRPELRTSQMHSVSPPRPVVTNLLIPDTECRLRAEGDKLVSNYESTGKDTPKGYLSTFGGSGSEVSHRLPPVGGLGTQGTRWRSGVPAVPVSLSLRELRASGRKTVQKGKSEALVKGLRGISKTKSQQGALGTGIQKTKKKFSTNFQLYLRQQFTFSNIMNTKAFNGALKEFFGSSPLSQFMDQINPLAELTHKRRLSSMGPGGVTRDSATLEIRGIHPSHYGRICPVETPEGKNTGLVNSLTAYARVNSNGYIETPFYRVYKGQVQKKTGLYFFSAKQEEKIQLGASDLYTSHIGFLPLASIPVRIFEDFTKISRNSLRYVGVQPIQMISIATSLIPFFEHDDGNRALMGSNMQRQAVPILKPQRPIVGTGLESRAVSDSGHVIQAKFSGVVTYVSSNKIQIYSF